MRTNTGKTHINAIKQIAVCASLALALSADAIASDSRAAVTYLPIIKKIVSEIPPEPEKSDPIIIPQGEDPRMVLLSIFVGTKFNRQDYTRRNVYSIAKGASGWRLLPGKMRFLSKPVVENSKGELEADAVAVDAITGDVIWRSYGKAWVEGDKVHTLHSANGKEPQKYTLDLSTGAVYWEGERMPVYRTPNGGYVVYASGGFLVYAPDFDNFLGGRKESQDEHFFMFKDKIEKSSQEEYPEE